MQFSAEEPKVPMVILFSLNLILFARSEWLIFLIFALIFIMATFIKYHFEIMDHFLFFTVSIFGLNILKRKTSYQNIKWIEFKRIGWYQKSVFIRLKEGIRWKIFRFHPDNFDEHIERFAIANSIAVKKRKNY